MARKRKLWSYSYGDYPDTVTVREKYLASNLYLRSRRDEDTALGFKVRGPDGQLDPAAEKSAREAAQSRNLDLRLQRTRNVTEPHKLTVGEGIERFAASRAMPKSSSARGQYNRHLARWKSHLKPATPWQSLVRENVSELLAVMKEDEEHAWEAWHALKVIRRVRTWLEEEAGFDGLKDPTKGLKLSKLVEGVEVRKPGFSEEEAGRLIGQRHHPDLDPRWALFLAFADDSGRRGVSIRQAVRSDLNRLPVGAAPPPSAGVPHGWIWYAGRKGQKGKPHPLTEFERQELDRALATWLSELEAAYQRGALPDYQLVPGEYFPDSGVYHPGHAGVRKPISYNTTLGWLLKAEEKAGVPHVERRGLHGIRRAWVRLTRPALGLETTQYAGGWSDAGTVAGYDEDMKWDAQIAARQVHEQKRRSAPENGKETGKESE